MSGVRLGGPLPAAIRSLLEPVTGQAGTAPDVQAALALAARLTSVAPLPGGGSTLARWTLLADLAAADLTVARVVEAHLDAVAILAEAGPDAGRLPGDAPGDDATWGVFAAEAPGARPRGRARRARRMAGQRRQALVLPGRSPLARPGHRARPGRPAAVRDLAAPRRRTGAGWGLARARTRRRALRAGALRPGARVAVGGPGWYLRRPGFAHGGIGVAACWYGGAVGVARALVAAARRREPDQLALWHIGAGGPRPGGRPAAPRRRGRGRRRRPGRGAAGELLALRVRSIVAAAAERSPGADRPRPRPRPAHPGRRARRAGSPTSRSTCVSTTPSVTSPRSAGPFWTPHGEPRNGLGTCDPSAGPRVPARRGRDHRAGLAGLGRPSGAAAAGRRHVDGVR